MERPGREYPITRFWYGKAARFKSIEELIDQDPLYFIWAVQTFQDVTPAQANHFKNKYGMELPDNVIAPKELKPYNPPKDIHKRPWDLTYKELCDQYMKGEL